MDTKKSKPEQPLDTRTVRKTAALGSELKKSLEQAPSGSTSKVTEYSKVLGERIRQCRGNASREEFGTQLQLHPNTVGKFERGESMPDAQCLILISEIGKRSAQWLLTGAELWSESADSEFVMVPGVGISASAGFGNYVNDENDVGKFAFKRSWLQRRGLKPSSLRVVAAKGDSMEPTVKNGDILLVDTSVESVSEDGIYLIEHDNDLRCKRLQSMIDGGVKIRSDNTRYETEIVPPGQTDMLRVVAKVVWIGGER